MAIVRRHARLDLRWPRIGDHQILLGNAGPVRIGAWHVALRTRAELPGLQRYGRVSALIGGPARSPAEVAGPVFGVFGTVIDWYRLPEHRK